MPNQSKPIERPILFNGEMVRAILNGFKTQTRRIVKNNSTADLWLADAFTPEFVADAENNLCPYGKIGDRLWVREKHKVKGLCSGCYEYACDCGHFEVTYAADNKLFGFDEWNADCDFPKTENWRPSIFLPRFLSRITLEITNIRLERLNEISGYDCHQEAAPGPLGEYRNGKGENGISSVTEEYKKIWESINGVGSWAKNPWVWVVEFKKIEQPKAAAYE